MKVLKIALLLLVTVILSVFLILGVILYQTKPVYEGKIYLNSPADSVSIHFDEYGIPHISAHSAHDAYYALGYVHASERLFQMDLLRRAGSGRLSELFGKEFTSIDAFFRTIGINENAIQSEKQFYLEADQDLQLETLAYLDGINEFIRSGKTPPEYLLPGIHKEEFTLRDIFNIIGYMAFSFAEGIRTDPILNQIYAANGIDYLDQIVYTDSLTKDPQKVSVPLMISLIENGITAPFRGSNAWAVASDRSASGKPLFANDTHIGYSQPCVWYEAHLEYPGMNLYGNFLAGFPFPLIGHTRQHSWGLTMLENDDIDFYTETLNPDDSTLYLAGKNWKKFEIRNEIIKRRNAPDTIVVVKLTRNGAVINNVIESVKGYVSNPVTLWWVFNHFPNQSLTASRLMVHASSPKEMSYACSLIAAPGLNVIYADTSGNIGWWSAGKMLKRKPGEISKIFKDGSKDENLKLEFAEFSENPHEVNPERGFVFSANRLSDSLLTVYPGYYAPSDRTLRIKKLLSEKEIFTLEDMKRIQNDVVNETYSSISQRWAKEIAALNLAKTENEKSFLSILKDWKGEHELRSQGPVVFYKLLSEILERTMSDDMDSASYVAFKTSHTMKEAYPQFLFNDISPWWDNRHTTAVQETRTMILEEAFQAAVRQLENQLGLHPENWRWEKVHTLTHSHALGKVKPLNHILNIGPFAVRGGNETLSNSGFPVTSDGNYHVSYGPAMRIVIDMADVENASSILPTGQSGNFLSPYYSDQASLYNLGKYRKMLFNQSEISRLKHKLILIPVNNR